MRRAAIILLGLLLGCDSRRLVVITPLQPAVDTGVPPVDTAVSPTISGHYHMEKLDRGLVAVSMADGSGVYLSWRMFGDEYDDKHPERIAYAINRDGATLDPPVTDSTNYFDSDGSPFVEYKVAAIIDGEAQDWSPIVTAWPDSQK